METEARYLREKSQSTNLPSTIPIKPKITAKPTYTIGMVCSCTGGAYLFGGALRTVAPICCFKFKTSSFSLRFSCLK